jgi:hypothetical protein
LTRKEWLTLPWSNDEAAAATAALSELQGMLKAVEDALDARVAYLGDTVPLRTFLSSNAPLIMADVSFK